MSSPGFRHLALGELDDDDLRAMLREGETLFVEFKKDVAKGTGFQIAKAAASFANTLGGWILVGVQNGRLGSDWEPPSGDFVDVVRQRLEGHVDPLPSFAAAVTELDAKKIGVIRVYESADTPHILSDGSVVVREPAQDSKLRKRGVYEPAPIRSHHELLQLAQRGRDAQAAAERRFAERQLPLVDTVLQIRWTDAASADRVFRMITADAPALVVRLAPLTVTRRGSNGRSPRLRSTRSRPPSMPWLAGMPNATSLGRSHAVLPSASRSRGPSRGPRARASKSRAESQPWPTLAA